MVHERSRDRDSLHLSAGELGGLFMHLLPQSDAFQLFLRPLSSLPAAASRQRHRKLDIAPQGLMRNQIIALKNKTDRVVAIGIPVTALIGAGRDAVDEQLTAVAVIQAADNIEQRRLSGAAGSQNRHELTFPERQRYAVQSLLDQRTCPVFFLYVFNLKHSPGYSCTNPTSSVSVSVSSVPKCASMSAFVLSAISCTSFTNFSAFLYSSLSLISDSTVSL